MSGARLLLLLALHVPASAAGKERPSELKEEVEVRGKASAGPPVSVPAPGADKAVTDEVIRSLDIYKTERKPGTKRARLSAKDERLERPFPEPPFLVLSPRSVVADYDRWTFEILEGDRPVWRTEGRGLMEDRIEWDGTGLTTPDGTARLDRPYSLRFSGEGDAPFVLSSDPVTLKSMALTDTIGSTHLELAASAVFERGKASFADEAERFLTAMAERMRRVHAPEDSYRLTLRAAAPAGKLAASRARRLKRSFAEALLINASKVEVEVIAAGERGEVLSCDLPPEGGQTIRTR